MEASDFKDDHLLKFKKIGNKYPVSVIILVVVIWLHTMCCNEVKDRLVNENYLQQIFEGAMIVLAFTGATFTDSWLGKYNALIGSIIFLIFTQITIIVKESLIKDFYISWIFDIFGLFFLSLAFCIQMSCEYCLAGDQFPLYQVKERKKIFSSLYLSTTFGILFADIFAHLIWVSKWFSKSYSLLLSGILMGTMSLILVTILWCKKFFFIEHPKGSALLEIFKCILFAMKNKLIHCSWKTPKRDHWLDWASEKYSENNIKAVKLFFRLLLFILPFPIFWALVNKQERKWDYQAIQMSHILRRHQVTDETVENMFSAVILFLLFLMELILFPFMEQLGISFSLIKKMVIGMLLIFFSSLGALILELKIQNSAGMKPNSRQSFLKVLNVADSTFDVILYKNNSHKTTKIIMDDMYPNYDAIDLDSDQDVFQLRVSSSTWFKKEEILLEEKTIYLLILSGKETLYSITLMKEDYEKPENGLAHVRIFNTLDKDIYIMLLVDTFRLQKHNGYSPQLSIRISRKVNLFYMIEEKKEVLQLKAGLLKFGSSYLLFIIQHVPVVKIHKVKLVQVKSFSVAWQFPQLFIKDLGRYFLTISCMEFFYYEAPKGLKVTMTALWTSTLYSSYIIMNFVSYISLLPEWIEYFLISCILLSIITAFFIISYYYKESYRENPSSEFTIIGNR
ncbi:solute carrier family 15 member 2-like isoform X1 [Sarcophilus harrisii]|uniref:solute carrier family 15 member 2-like isoform X1 n=1 Tax=Sarcophilus harrisii TaxID=9305 RepID=UPI0002271D19|nr:solute carrier family 15 member 2-like isoform X1 [Sarcophilus harrisii]